MYTHHLIHARLAGNLNLREAGLHLVQCREQGDVRREDKHDRSLEFIRCANAVSFLAPTLQRRFPMGSNTLP